MIKADARKAEICSENSQPSLSSAIQSSYEDHQIYRKQNIYDRDLSVLKKLRI